MPSADPCAIAPAFKVTPDRCSNSARDKRPCLPEGKGTKLWDAKRPFGEKLAQSLWR